jgi:hypothetical protein
MDSDDPFELLMLYDPAHTYRAEEEGDSFRAKCSCGWVGKRTHDNEYSARWQGFAHQWLQRN